MSREIEFEVGKPILYDSKEYVVTKILGPRSIQIGVGQAEIGSKHLIKKCMEQHPGEYDFCIAKWFIQQKRQTHSQYRSVRNADPQKHRLHIRRMIELDGVEPAEVIDILFYTLNDEFWKDQLLTLTSLRNRSQNKLMKWENIRKSLMTQLKRRHS